MTKSRTLRKAGAVALSLAMALSIAGTIPASAAAKKVKLSSSKGTIKVNKTKKVTIKNTKKTNIKKVKFTYSKKGIVTAKRSGLTLKFKGKKAGTTTITSKITLKKAVAKKKVYTLKYKATVKKAATTPTGAPVVAVTGVTLSNTAPKVGDTITATVEPSNATGLTYAWYRADKADGTFTLIEGATIASYTTTAADVNKFIKVQVNGDSESTASAVTTAAVAENAEEELKIEGKQTGASTIVLTANKAVATTDTVTVTRGTSVVSSTFAVDAAGTTVTITTGTKLAEAEYKVTVKPADSTKAAAECTVKCSAAILEKIDFVGENLILADSTYKQASVKIFGYNSFGEEVALSTLTPYTSKGDVEYKASDNEIIIKATGTALFQTGEQITVTAVYQDGTNVKQVSKALTVSAAATLAEIKLGDLKSSNAALKDKRVDLTNMSSGTYYKEVEAKDQYGNTLTAAKLNSMLYTTTNTTGTLFATPSQADGAYVYLTGFDTTADKKVIAKYNLGSLKMPGKQLFTFTAVGGYSATDEIEVVDNSYIATLTVEVPELYGGKESEIIVSAVDQYGEAVNIYDVADAKTVDQTAAATSADYVFKGQNSTTKTQAKITVPAGMKLKVTKNTSKKTVKFTLTPKANTTANNVQYVLLTQSAVPTIANVQCVVQPNADVYGIAASLKNGGTSITTKNSVAVDLGANVNILDQYGAVMGTLNDVVGKGLVVVDSTKKVEGASQNGGGHNDGDFVVNIIDKAGNLETTGATCLADTYTVSLWKIGSKAGSTANTGDSNSKLAERTFTVIEADAAYSSYTASIKKGDELLYVGSDQDTATVEVKGTDAKGNTVALAQGTDFTITVDNMDILMVAGAAVKSNHANNHNLAKAGKKIEGTATITVWSAAGDEVATTTVKYSNEAPKADSIAAAKSTDGGSNWAAYADTEITLTTGFTSVKEVITPGSTADAIIKDTGAIWYKVGIHDQYGLPFEGQSVALNGEALKGGAETIGAGKTKTLKVTGGSLNQAWSIVNGSGAGINLAGIATSVTALSAIASKDLSASTLTITGANGAGKIFLSDDTTIGDADDIQIGTFTSGGVATLSNNVSGLVGGTKYYTVLVPNDTSSYTAINETTGKAAVAATAKTITLTTAGAGASYVTLGAATAAAAFTVVDQFGNDGCAIAADTTAANFTFTEGDADGVSFATVSFEVAANGKATINFTVTGGDIEAGDTLKYNKAASGLNKDIVLTMTSATQGTLTLA